MFLKRLKLGDPQEATDSAQYSPKAPKDGDPIPFDVADGFAENFPTSLAPKPVAKVAGNSGVDEEWGEAPDGGKGESRSPQNREHFIREMGGSVGWAITVAFAGAFVIALRAFVADVFVIGSPAMDPTLSAGDRIVVDKLSYQWRSPERGEILVFNPPKILQDMRPQADQPFILRIVGVPGDRLKIQGGQLYVNGQPLPESYLQEPTTYEMAQVTVPENTYFVLGDNRNDSFDSSIWGIVPASKIIGRATSVVYPLGKFGEL